MTPVADTSFGDPVIAGDPMSGNEFDLFTNEEVMAQYMKSPDALQTQMNSDDPKTFLDPRDLVAGPLPDSPASSIHDSSSDAASTRHFNTMFPRPSEGAGADLRMDDEMDEPLDWGDQNMVQYDGGLYSELIQDREPLHPNSDSFFQFGDPGNMMVDRPPFDFDVASKHSDQSGNRMPDMPTLNGQSPQQAGPSSRMREQCHRKRSSQYSTASSRAGRKREASRDPSPMSINTAGHPLSPPAILQDLPAHANSDLSPANGVHMWTNALCNISSPVPDGNLHAVQFPTMAHELHMPQFNHPPFQLAGQYNFMIYPTPLKSRVETQIPITMMLNPLPPGITKLHLPPHTISKPKLLARPRPRPSSDTLELFVSLVCTSAMDHPGFLQNALERAARTPQGHLPNPNDEANSPQNGGEVRICAGCITRERKRAARKKTRKPEEDQLWSQDEERRVIVFNTQEIKEWQPCSGMLDANGRPESIQHSRAMQIDAPMRIACYCRHHHEKMGFNVIFTLKDWKGHVLAQALSNPIMITDDHKTNPVAQMTTQPPPSLPDEDPNPSTHLQHPQHMEPGSNNTLAPGANGTFNGFSSSSSTANQMNGRSSNPIAAASGKTTPVMAPAAVPARTLSRPQSPVQNGHLAKKRKSKASRVPNDLTMTRLDTSPAATSNGAANNVQQASALTSPFSPLPNGNLMPQTDALFGQQNHQVSFIHSPLVSNNPDMQIFANRRSESMDNLALSHLYNSAPTSNHASRAPSPNGLRNSVNNIAQAQLAQNFANGMYSLSMAMNQPRATPIIHKIIPNEGPTVGGIEVTVLGASFFQGLEVWFGDNKATTTTYWGDSSLVCLLPPSPTPGYVPVTFGQSISVSHFQGKQPPTFKYIDDSEDKLIRTALSVLGLKISGKMFDVNDLARRILHDGDSDWPGGSPAGSSGTGSVFKHTSRQHLETQLFRVLDMIDQTSSANRTRLDLKGSTGHTMLHLASALGYHRFVATLLMRGANKNARDRGGFTPLHLATIYNHPELVRRLVIAGADVTIRSFSGLSAEDVAQSRVVARTIRNSQRHMRSRSGGLLQTRTTSFTSMGSMWEPLTKVEPHQEPLSVDSGEESPEYTTDDFEDEDPDENVGLSMKRLSRLNLENNESSEDSMGLDNGAASNTTVMAAAVKEQFHTQLQQLQQSMGLYLQNLTNLPQKGMPQMRNFSGLPMIPDYQAYLPQAPFMRRVQQLVPGISGNRDDTPAGDDQPKMDSRWRDISSYNKNSAAGPPPAYDDIFPQNLNNMIQSVTGAAADDEIGDELKFLLSQHTEQCAKLFGKAAATITDASSKTKKIPEVLEAAAAITDASSKTKKIPQVLKIGRKNAITREQQDNFLRAREQKLKMLSNDRNLFFIWIPLLLVMITALLYSYFPALFSFIWKSVYAILLDADIRGRVMDKPPKLPFSQQAVEVQA